MMNYSPKILLFFAVLFATGAEATKVNTELEAGVEVRFLKSTIAIAKAQGATADQELEVIETSILTHVWFYQDPEDGQNVFFNQTTIPGSRIVNDKKTKFDVMQGKVLVFNNFMGFGIEAFKNLERLCELGVVKRVDYGVIEEGFLYLETVTLVNGHTYNQEEIRHALKLIGDTKNKVPSDVDGVNMYFASALLSEARRKEIIAPFERALLEVSENLEVSPVGYLNYDVFKAAIEEDKVDAKNAKSKPGMKVKS